MDERMTEPTELATASTAHRGGTPVVRVTGEIDLATVPKIAKHLHSELDEGPRSLVVDLSGVDFLASAGLAMLLELHQHASRVGGALVVVAAHRAVLRPLRSTGMGSLFDLRPDLDSALRDVTVRA
jgi:anti-anti-sigma factor